MGIITTLLRLYNRIGDFKKRNTPVYIITSTGARTAYYIRSIELIPGLNAVGIFAGEEVVDSNMIILEPTDLQKDA